MHIQMYCNIDDIERLIFEMSTVLCQDKDEIVSYILDTNWVKGNFLVRLGLNW